jgi:hypothetical protein
VEVSARLDGSAEWEAALLRKERAVDKATRKAVTEGLRVIERRGKLLLRTYTHPPGTPTTSPPGSPPALVTGNLMRSWVKRGPLPGRHRHEVRGEVGPTTVYARIQELGGRVRIHHRGQIGPQRETSYAHIPARPYVKPATDQSRPLVRRVFVRRYSEALRA